MSDTLAALYWYTIGTILLFMGTRPPVHRELKERDLVTSTMVGLLSGVCFAFATTLL